jgi:peptide/nickel transport system permease protein
MTMASDSDSETAVGDGPAAVGPSRRRETWQAILSNKLAVFGLVVLAALIITGVTGSLLAPHDPTRPADLTRLAETRMQAPSLAHPFGTDELGRDVLSRVIAGARVSLQVGFIAVGLSLVAGTAVGVVAGFYGRWVDDLLMRATDVLFAFPPLLLAIAILAILGPLGLSTESAMIALGVAFTPIFARITRGSVLSVREAVYVRAARSLGASDWRLIRLHVLPNVAAPIIVQTSLSLAFAILLEAGLSFLGLGVQPPTPSWGRMLAEGRGFLSQAWWMAFFPGMAIFLTVLAFNLVGDALRDALDPRQKSAIEARGMGE